MAELGAIRQDAAWLRLVPIETSSAILLVKSDLKTRLETILCAVGGGRMPGCLWRALLLTASLNYYSEFINRFYTANSL
ncbi:MAG: hypothetical protein K2H52_07900 [Lachnospiraceae bacterium]|nr:hypothetical protein [Lachnospiraceae bacterium]